MTNLLLRVSNYLTRIPEEDEVSSFAWVNYSTEYPTRGFLMDTCPTDLPVVPVGLRKSNYPNHTPILRPSSPEQAGYRTKQS